MKTCITCKHFAPTFFMRLFNCYSFVKCRHPKNADPVTGGAGLYCELARRFSNNCESEGKLWEPTK
jgi:hypothetical protein